MTLADSLKPKLIKSGVERRFEKGVKKGLEISRKERFEKIEKMKLEIDVIIVIALLRGGKDIEIVAKATGLFKKKIKKLLQYELSHLSPQMFKNILEDLSTSDKKN